MLVAALLTACALMGPAGAEAAPQGKFPLPEGFDWPFYARAHQRSILLDGRVRPWGAQKHYHRDGAAAHTAWSPYSTPKDHCNTLGHGTLSDCTGQLEGRKVEAAKRPVRSVGVPCIFERIRVLLTGLLMFDGDCLRDKRGGEAVRCREGEAKADNKTWSQLTAELERGGDHLLGGLNEPWLTAALAAAAANGHKAAVAGLDMGLPFQAPYAGAGKAFGLGGRGLSELFKRELRSAERSRVVLPLWRARAARMLTTEGSPLREAFMVAPPYAKKKVLTALFSGASDWAPRTWVRPMATAIPERRDKWGAGSGAEVDKRGVPHLDGYPVLQLPRLVTDNLPPAKFLFVAYIVIKGGVRGAEADRVAASLRSMLAAYPYPKGRVAVLTDEDTDIGEVVKSAGGDDVVTDLRFAIDRLWQERILQRPATHMLLRAMMEMVLLRRVAAELKTSPRAPIHHIVFVDTDLLFLSKLPFLNLPYEIAVSVRDHGRMGSVREMQPYNLGLKAVHKDATEKAAALWEGLVGDMMENEGTDGRKLLFFSDQVAFFRALRSSFSPPYDHARFYDQVTSGEEFTMSARLPEDRAVDILNLNCALYNAPPGGISPRGCLPTPTAHVLHFKGPLKVHAMDAVVAALEGPGGEYAARESVAGFLAEYHEGAQKQILQKIMNQPKNRAHVRGHQEYPIAAKPKANNGDGGGGGDRRAGAGRKDRRREERRELGGFKKLNKKRPEEYVHTPWFPGVRQVETDAWKNAQRIDLPEDYLRSHTHRYKIGESVAAGGPFHSGPFEQGCAKRDWDVPPLRHAGDTTRVGVVVVFCTETPHWLLNLTCEDTTYYLYSKCSNLRKGTKRNPTGRFTLEHVANIARCSHVYEGDETAANYVPYVKHHAQYFHHIVANYDRLHPQMMFLKGVVRNNGGELDVPGAVAATRAHPYAFKMWGRDQPDGVGHGRAKEIIMHSGAPTNFGANHTNWKREMCGMWERYICHNECNSRGRKPDGLWYNPHTLFSVSRERLMSLPRGEYVMLMHQALQLNGYQGIMRRFLHERSWHMILGCPEDMHLQEGGTTDQFQSLGGCLPDQHFPSGEARHPHPAFFPPRPVDAGPVTFVSFVTADPNAGDTWGARTEVRRALEAAMLGHPWSRLVVITDGSEAARESGAFLETYFEERLEVVHPERLAADHLVGARAENSDLVRLQLELERRWMERHLKPGPGGKWPHTVFLDPKTWLLSNITALLSRQGFDVAVVVRDERAEPVSSSLRVVRSGARDAAIRLWRLATEEAGKLEPFSEELKKAQAAKEKSFKRGKLHTILWRGRMEAAMGAALGRAECGDVGKKASGKGEWAWKGGDMTVECGSGLALFIAPCKVYGATVGDPDWGCSVDQERSVVLHDRDGQVFRMPHLDAVFGTIISSGNRLWPAREAWREHEKFVEKGPMVKKAG